MYCVYILRTLDDTLYIGVSGSLRQRIGSHNGGKGAEWIKAHRGARLVYVEPHATLSSARRTRTPTQEMDASKKRSAHRGKFRAVAGFESVQINS
jgi:putative endonuclease